MYMWFWLHQESMSLFREKRPLTAGEYYYWWQPASLSPLSFRCSHCRRLTLSVLHTRQRGKVWKNPLLKNLGFLLKWAKFDLMLWLSLCSAAAQTQARWRNLDFYVGYHLLRPPRKVTITIHTHTHIYNNNNNNNNCNKACVLKRGRGEVSLRPTESSAGWLLPFMCC